MRIIITPNAAGAMQVQGENICALDLLKASLACYNAGMALATSDGSNVDNLGEPDFSQLPPLAIMVGTGLERVISDLVEEADE